MHVESPFFEKSSVHFILTRARGLGILTFDKIRKIAFLHKINKTGFKSSGNTFILSKRTTPRKNDVKKFFMEYMQVVSLSSVSLLKQRKTNRIDCVYPQQKHPSTYPYQKYYKKKQDSLESLTTEEMQITKTILSDKYGKTIITITNKLQIGQEKGLIGGYKIIIEDN